MNAAWDAWSLWCRCTISMVAQQRPAGQGNHAVQLGLLCDLCCWCVICGQMHGLYALDAWSLWYRCSISLVAQQRPQDQGFSTWLLCDLCCWCVICGQMHGIYALDVWSLWCRCSISVVAQQRPPGQGNHAVQLGRYSRHAWWTWEGSATSQQGTVQHCFFAAC